MSEWKHFNSKHMRSSVNKEIITGRCLLRNKKNDLTISIGKDIADSLGFKKNDRINVFFHKRDRDLLLIKKSITPFDGYSLRFGDGNCNFMTFSFRFPTHEDFKLSQTIPLAHDLENDSILLVNVKPLKWSK